MEKRVERLLCSPIERSPVFKGDTKDFVRRLVVRLGLVVIGELVQLTEEYLENLEYLSVHILNDYSIGAIKKSLALRGLSLGMELDHGLKFKIARHAERAREKKLGF